MKNFYHYKKEHRETFCSNETCVDYGVDDLNLDENNIKIGSLLHKYRYLAYVVCTNGYRYREWIDRTNIVLSINLCTTKSRNL